MRVIFMGTPDFSVGTLEAIIEAGHEVALVVTQPDKPKGRGKTMQYTPVKECALSHGIEVFQPVKIRETANIEYLRKFNADIIIVVAFGQILSKSILDMPRYGCINVHASLLPKYRGAAPIQWAVINGDEFTGVTTMRMDEAVVGLAGLGGAGAPGIADPEPRHAHPVAVGAAIAEDAQGAGVFHIKCKGLPRQLRRHGPGDEGRGFGGAVLGGVPVAAVDCAHGVRAEVPDCGSVGGDSVADAGELGHHRR